MEKLITKYISNLPTTQGNQIIALVDKLQKDGTIQNEKEYRDTLAELSLSISGENPQPLSTLLPALVKAKVSSERYNYILEFLKRDLDALFGSLNELDETLDAHKRIFQDVILTQLKASVEKLEKTVGFFEFTNSAPDFFSAIQFNTFTQSSEMTTRDDPNSRDLFVDYHTGDLVSNVFDITMDLASESIKLPSSKKPIIFKEARIVDGISTPSIKRLDLPGTGIENAIDNTIGTFWINSVMMNNISSAGLVDRIELETDGIRLVNFIEVQPLAKYPFKIEGIEYENEFGVIGNLLPPSVSTTLFAEEISKPFKVSFSAKKIKKIFIDIRQDNYEEMSLDLDKIQEKPFDAILSGDKNYIQKSTSAIEKEIRDIVSNINMLEFIPLSTKTPQLTNVYMYMYGFDNIITGLSSYKNTGIFVGEKFSVAGPGIIGLTANEKLPEAGLGSFEYTIFKRDFDAEGNVLGIDVFPILPYNVINETTPYIEERLDLSNLGSGKLRFIAHSEVDSSLYDIEIKRDGTVLTEIDDYTVTGNTRNTTISIINFSSSTSNIYTARYKPRHIFDKDRVDSSTGRIVKYYLDVNQKLWLRSDGMIEHDLSRGSDDIANSDLFLIVIMKKNDFDDDETPELLDYRLSIGTVDTEKFTVSL